MQRPKQINYDISVLVFTLVLLRNVIFDSDHMFLREAQVATLQKVKSFLQLNKTNVQIIMNWN